MTNLSLFAGQTARDEGMASVASHNVDFLTSARKTAVTICRQKGVVTSDDLREWSDRAGIAPDHPNAWGSVFRSCPLKGYVWERVDYKQSRYESNHARVISVWTLTKTDQGVAA